MIIHGVFFFKQKTAYEMRISDWSSDVCSSDLRSLKKLIATAEDLEREKIGLVSLTESIDTTTPGGMLTFHVFGAIAQFERALIRERTTAGLVEARRQGRKGGRPDRKSTRLNSSH